MDLTIPQGPRNRKAWPGLGRATARSVGSRVRLLTVSSHSEWKVMCFLDSRVRTSPVFGSQAEDEHEMRARTIYYTNIHTKAGCGEVYRLRLLGDYHHPTRISFVEFVMAESAVSTLNCSGMLLGSLQIRVFPFPQSENMNLDDRGGKAWSCGGDASVRWRCEHRCAEVFMGEPVLFPLL
uniref:RRM domain-containing protein n=1 Tax=Brassica oleracea var. oleracea TaxID=109376 RepID=A0A0D3CH59_BRAOL